MNITIVGGGNIGTQFAVHCSEMLHHVMVFSSKPERFHSHISIVDENGTLIHQGVIAGASSDPETTFSNVDLIFVTVPAECMSSVAKKIYPYVKAGMMIGLIPGTGGGECAFRGCLEKGAIIFGLQRVPGVARLVEYGKSVCVTGYREKLHVAALPYKDTEKARQIVSDIFNMPCEALPNYLNLTLTPSNPILHTTRLKTIFDNYRPGVSYDSIPLFYEEWTDMSSQLLLDCDDEVQQICRKLNQFDLAGVKSLRIHYESQTIQQITQKISSIKSFRGLTTPSVKKDGRYIPDLHSRYFVSDFSFGLSILVQIADFVGVDAVNLKETLEWYQTIKLEKEEYHFTDYGIRNYEEFVSFYRQ